MEPIPAPRPPLGDVLHLAERLNHVSATSDLATVTSGLHDAAAIQSVAALLTRRAG